jgi:phosphoserine phosphatase
MADTWFMRITGNPIAINPGTSMRKMAIENDWAIKTWKI